MRGAKFNCATCDNFYYCYHCYMVFLVQSAEELKSAVKTAVPETCFHNVHHKFELDKPVRQVQLVDPCVGQTSRFPACIPGAW